MVALYILPQIIMDKQIVAQTVIFLAVVGALFGFTVAYSVRIHDQVVMIGSHTSEILYQVQSAEMTLPDAINSVQHNCLLLLLSNYENP